jgi:large subunit ribosomal protein L23
MDYNDILTKPRITEKAVRGMNTNTYTFDVSPRATKLTVAAAVKAVYGFTPTAVRVIVSKQKAKKDRKSGKPILLAGGKKAMVTLKKGDTIAVF